MNILIVVAIAATAKVTLGLSQQRPQKFAIIENDADVDFGGFLRLAAKRKQCSDKFYSDVVANVRSRTNYVSAGVGNICIGEHLAPELFVLGAQKSSTTSFAFEFMAHPQVVSTKKELHFFNDEKNYKLMGGSDKYLQLFGECSRNGRKVAVDMTPNYLPSTYAPSAIANLYAEQAYKIRFAFILREPVARSYSAYHHVRRSGWADGYYRNISFQDLADKLLEDGHNASSLSIWRYSNYAEQIRLWFSTFDSAQFTVAPFLYNVAPEIFGMKKKFHVHMWDKLDMTPCNSDGKPVSHVNSGGGYTPIDQAITSESYARLKQYIYEVTGPEKLSEILHGTNAELYGCEGCSKSEVVEWLARGWG